MKVSKKMFSGFLVLILLFGLFSFSVSASNKEDNTILSGVITDQAEVNKMLENMKRTRSSGSVKVRFKNKFSGKYLDVVRSGESGTDVIQYEYNGGANQIWLLKYDSSSSSYWICTSYNPILNLDVDWAINENGTPIKVCDIGWSTSRWRLQFSSGNGGYRLLTSCSEYKKCIAVQHASLLNDAKIIQWDPSNIFVNDIWIMELIV